MDFKKTPKQQEATILMASEAKHIMLLGGSRSGKTAIIVRNIIIRACKEPNSRHISLRHTFNSVKTSIWMDTLPKVLKLAFPNLKVKWNKSDYCLTFPNGSEYWIAGLDDEKRVDKILGKEFASIHFNECTQLAFSSVQTALTRLAQKTGLKNKAYYDMNPTTKSSWPYIQFIKKLNPTDSEPIKKPENYVWMRINPEDNLDNIDQDYLEMLESLPERERERFLKGEFIDSSDGTVYYEFKRDLHVKETQRYNGTLFIASDFNIDPMCSVVFQIINGVFHIQDEFFLRNCDTYRLVSEFKKKNYTGANIIPDSTAKNRKTSGKSDIQILNESGFKVLPTRNPFVVDRVNNINRLLKDEKIIINPRCKKLINDLELVSWKDNKLNQKTDPMLTHISDALGYGCWKLNPIGFSGKKQIRLS